MSDRPVTNQQHKQPAPASPEVREGSEIPEGTTAVTTDLAPNLALPWVVRLRYGMVAGQAAIVLGIGYWAGFDPALRWTLLPLAIVLASNILLARLRLLPARFPQETLGAAFCLDTLCLTAMLGLTGGPMNPFSLLYLVQITLSAVVLKKAWTWALGVLATACFGLLFFFYAPSGVFQAHHVESGVSPHLVGMWVAFVSAAVLITFFTGKIADALRKREQEVRALQDRVAKQEKLASLVTLAAGAAHELGTPLGTIAVVARELERYAASVPENDAVLEDARLIRSEVDRCRRILEQMSAKSAEPGGETPVRIRVRELLRTVVHQLPESQRALLRIELADEELTAVLPAKASGQALGALIRNALDANVDSRPILITAAASAVALQIEVRDRGHGMPAHVLRRIAEPFFTTKEPGKGMGLGTFLVRTFAENLGGSVRFNSVPGEGTTVTLELPVPTSEQSAYAFL